MTVEQGWERVNVLVADDHTMILEMIGMVVSNTPSINLTTCTDVDGVLRSIADNGAYDLVLLDVDMPGMSGLEGLKRVMSANGGKPVGILTGNPSPRVIEAVTSLGAAGVVPKTTSMRSLTNAMRFMAAGEKYLPLELMRERDHARNAVPTPLSERELTVLMKLADGMPNREIGEALELAEATIKMHVKSICRKLGVTNRTQAVIAARNLRLV